VFLKGVDPEDEQFLQLRELIENTANQLTPHQERYTWDTMHGRIREGEWFLSEPDLAYYEIAGNPDQFLFFLEDYGFFIGEEFDKDDWIHYKEHQLPSMQVLIDSGELRVAPMWKFYDLDKKHRREDAKGEHLECILCHEVPLEEDPIPHMVKITKCKCHHVFHIDCFKSMLGYCASKCPFCSTPFPEFDLETNPTGLNERSNWSDFFHELSINPDDTSEDKVYSFRDGTGDGDAKYRKFIEAHVNKSPANPDSCTVSMSELLLRYRTFAVEHNLPFHFSKDDKALKLAMVAQFGEPTVDFPSIQWSGIVLFPSVAENIGDGAGAGAGAGDPSIFVQTETLADAFAKLATEESATEHVDTLMVRVKAVKEGTDPRSFSPLRERFDILYDLPTPELQDFADATLSPDPWGDIARNILVYRNAPWDDVIKLKEALFMTLEGFCEKEDKRLKDAVDGAGASSEAVKADQESGDDELRQRFDALFELNVHELAGLVSKHVSGTETMNNNLFEVAGRLMDFKLDDKEVSNEMREALWQKVENP
jgi:hypothetical protein